MSDNTNVQDAVNAGVAAAAPAPLDRDGRFFQVVTPPDCNSFTVDLEELREDLLEQPRRKTGHVKVYDAASFAYYWRKHQVDGTSEVYADVVAQRIVGVLNGHGAADPGWGDHRVELLLRKTPAWQAWEKMNGSLVNQVQFAQHIEDRLIDIVSPAGAVMLELAQTFQAKTKVSFESSKRLSSGERQLEYRENIEAAAGRKGDITIPETFELGIAPFEGSPAYKVIARLRYRLADGNLAIGFALERPEDVLRAAFGDVLDDLQDKLTIDVLAGIAP